MARPFGTKNIETPERLWELFEGYRNMVKSNPFLITDWVGAKAIEVIRAKEKPLTMVGFENYSRKEVGEVHQYFENANDSYKDYLTICRAIRDEIKQDQIEGGMAMIYNPSITQRLNGLVEKTQTDLSASINILNVDPLDDSSDNSTP